MDEAGKESRGQAGPWRDPENSVFSLSITEKLVKFYYYYDYYSY